MDNQNIPCDGAIWNFKENWFGIRLHMKVAPLYTEQSNEQIHKCSQAVTLCGLIQVYHYIKVETETSLGRI